MGKGAAKEGNTPAGSSWGRREGVKAGGGAR